MLVGCSCEELLATGCSSEHQPLAHASLHLPASRPIAASALRRPASWLPPAGDAYAAAAAAVGTDFRQWSEAEVRAFLEQRGEDYDDCPDLEALVGAKVDCFLFISGCVKASGASQDLEALVGAECVVLCYLWTPPWLCGAGGGGGPAGDWRDLEALVGAQQMFFLLRS